MNQGELYRWGRRMLFDHDIDTAAFDAMTLLCRCLQKDRQQILVHGEDPVSPEAETRYRAQIAQRAARGAAAIPARRLGVFGYDPTGRAGGVGAKGRNGAIVPAGSRLTATGRRRTRPLRRNWRRGAGLAAAVSAENGAGCGKIRTGFFVSVPEYSKMGTRLCKSGQSRCFARARGRKMAPPVDFLLSNPPYVTPKAYEGLQEEVKKEPLRLCWAAKTGCFFIGRLPKSGCRS